jgi:hypothetical protein
MIRKVLFVSCASCPTGSDMEVQPLTKVFGVPLTEAVKLSNPNGNIPLVIQLATEYLNSNGLDTVGLYRVSANFSIVNDYALVFDALGTINFYEKGNDTHDVAGLIRKFLKDLPEPIFTNEHADKFILHQVPKDLRAYRIYESLKDLPEYNRETIRSLVYHWKLLTDNSNVNQMTINTLMKSIFSMSPFALAYHVMIEQYDQIFVDYINNSDNYTTTNTNNTNNNNNNNI